MQSRLQRRPTAYCILVDLEMLFDVRAGVLETLYPGVMLELLKKNYHQRFNDNFGKISSRIDQAKYEEAYKSRNVTHLKESRSTGYLMWLVAETERVLKESITAHIYDEFYLDINFTQFGGLSREERKEFMETFGEIFPAEFGIEEVNIRLTNLTPSFLNSNYNQFMIYNYIDWFEHHFPVMASNEQLLRNKMPNCDVFAPGLFKNNVEQKDTLVSLIEGGEETSVLEVQVRGTSAFFTLNYVHPAVTSIIDPIELQSFVSSNKPTTA